MSAGASLLQCNQRTSADCGLGYWLGCRILPAERPVLEAIQVQCEEEIFDRKHYNHADPV